MRLSTARTFFRWCIRTGIVTDDPSAHLERLKKLYPKTYGKVQSALPAQWLDKDRAFGALITACQDGSWFGSRDQLAIRLGLMGCRSGDVLGMTWGDLRPDGRFMWMGKGRRQRTITPRPTFATLLARWRRAYEAGLGHPAAPTDQPCAMAVQPVGRRGG